MRAILFSLLLSNHLFAENLVIQQAEFGRTERHKYFSELLNLAMKKSGIVKNYDVVESKDDRYQGFNVKAVKRGKIDLIWTMTDKERESELLPIRIPLLKGMLSHRICIINQSKKGAFAGIKSIDDFNKKGFTIGQGHDWPDTKVLKANKLNVVTGNSYEGLFTMLEKERFHCYARGVNEPWEEVKKFGNGKLLIDDKISFIYRSPVYFFVNKKAKDLAKKIEMGLEKAIDDGSFDKVFEKYNSKYLALSQLSKRNNILLDNPTLSKESADLTKKARYWLKIK